MANRKKRQRNMAPDLEKWIKRKARRGESPISIYREMEKSEEWKHLENLPILRTVQNMVKEQTIRDKTEPWSVADEDFSPEDARLILDVLADVIAISAERRFFTKAEATWVLRVRRLAPRLFLNEVWEVARAYMVAEDKGESTSALDTFLAFMPWKNKNRRDNFQEALDSDWIDEPETDCFLWTEGVTPRKYVNLAPLALGKLREKWFDQTSDDHDARIGSEEAATWAKNEEEDKNERTY